MGCGASAKPAGEARPEADASTLMGAKISTTSYRASGYRPDRKSDVAAEQAWREVSSLGSVAEEDDPKPDESQVKPKRNVVDTSESGRVNRIKVDSSKTGKYDTILKDTKGDGKMNVVMKDTNGDGKINRILQDTTGDGKYDLIQDDTLGTGVINRVAKDTTGDGFIDVIEEDTAGRGMVNRKEIDTKKSGIRDHIEVDTTGDGTYDMVIQIQSEKTTERNLLANKTKGSLGSGALEKLEPPRPGGGYE
jgi:hypothetical protein